MALLRTAPHKLQHALHVAHLHGVRPEAVVASRLGALLAGALARTAVPRRDRRLLGRRRRRAKRQGEAVLREVLARGPGRARADELPLVQDVADLDARVGGGAAVGAEFAIRRGDHGRREGGDEGGGREGEEGEGLHFGWGGGGGGGGVWWVCCEVVVGEMEGWIDVWMIGRCCCEQSVV